MRFAEEVHVLGRKSDEFAYDGYQTWDGEPVSKELPHGATVVVFRA